MNALCPLRQAVRSFPQQPAVFDVCRQERISFRQLDQDADRIAMSLRREHIPPGSRIAWIDRDTLKSIRLIWGCCRAEMTACPLSPRWPPALVVQACQAIEITALVSQLSTDGGVECQHQGASSAATPELATIIFSSGSSGSPKAVAHRGAAHLASASGANHNLPLAIGDRWLLSLPLYHVGGLGILFRCAIAGAELVIAPKNLIGLTPDNPWGVSHASFVPTQLLRIVEREPRVPVGLKGLLLGGAPLPQSLVDLSLAHGWPLCNTYGMTEMASQITATSPTGTRDDLTTNGRILPGRELRIESDGQVAVRGNTLMSGYLSGGVLHCPLTDDGWFLTGDLGRLDASQRLVIDGRLDNRFVSGGENIYPEEIERLLVQIPGVRQALVVPIPHAEYGARPVAFVDSLVSRPSDWNAILAEQLPRFKLPDRYYAWMTTGNLKPDRRTLIDHIERDKPTSLTDC